MKSAPVASLFRRPAPPRRNGRQVQPLGPAVVYGRLDPAISFKRSSRSGDEGEPTRQDYIDTLAGVTYASRYEDRLADRLLRPSPTFEPDYDEDPADSVRASPAAQEWRSPLSSRDFPRVEIGPRYRTSLPIAERALALAAQRVRGDEIVLHLSVEFDLGWDVVKATLDWMGVTDDVYPHLVGRRSDFGKARGVPAGLPEPERFADPLGGPLHGTDSRYCSAKHQCRCESCQAAHSIAGRRRPSRAM